VNFLSLPCRKEVQYCSHIRGTTFQNLPRLSETAVNTERYIQGDSGGICNTLGNDNTCDSKQKSSYEHGSDFELLLRL
jgi:hypothetical protein